jgi:hypothetical protein
MKGCVEDVSSMLSEEELVALAKRYGVEDKFRSSG